MKIAIAIIATIILLIVGDWFQLFGARLEQVPDFIHIIFETRDAATGAAVEEVHVNCSRPPNRSVCSERLTGTPGQTEITFGVFRERRKSLLFTHDLGFSFGSSSDTTLMFVHPNYERHKMSLSEEMIAQRRRQNITIRLTKMTQ